MHEIIRNKLLVVTYMLTLLYALHYGLPLYATSSFLHQYFNSSIISGLYMLGSIGALLASIYISKHIKQFHIYKFTFSIVVAEIISILMFAFTKNLYILSVFFISHFILTVLLYMSLNVFIESFSKHAEIGSIRGLFLALLNIGILISPLIGGTILSYTSFAGLYFVSSMMLVPFLFFLHKYLKYIKEPAYHTMNMGNALKSAWHNKNLRAALIGELAIQCFYAVMIIYSPIYLTNLGIPLTIYLTMILPFALVPLVVLPYELGLIADTKIGEKELLIVGLVILTITTFLCVTITSTSPIVWIAVLLTSRIGASFVETMSFTYYFKKIGPEDAALTALFTNTSSVATCIVGALGFVISPLLVDRPQLMFIILGCAILFSISYVLPMRDTK